MLLLDISVQPRVRKPALW